MSSPVGHGLAGLAVWSVVRGSRAGDEVAGRRCAAAAVGLAVLPDLEHVFRAARGALHAPIWGVLIGILVTLALRRRGEMRWTPGILLAAAWASHGALDYLVGYGHNVPLLYPFSQAGWQSPYPLLPLPLSSPGWETNVWLLHQWIAWRAILLEALIWGSPSLAAWVLRSRMPRGWRRTLAALFASVAVGAWCVSFWIEMTGRGGWQRL